MTCEGLTDTRVSRQILAGIMSEPSLLDEYSIDKEDFTDPFHQLIFGTIYNLYYINGVTHIDPTLIDNYLASYEVQYKVFLSGGGLDFLYTSMELYEKGQFAYYHRCMRKLSCLRYWESNGLDTRSLFDSTRVGDERDNEVNKLKNTSIDQMIDTMEAMLINEPRLKFSSGIDHIGQSAGTGLRDLVASFKEAPDYGLPMQSPIMSTISRGCRLGKFYLRSGSSGSGKTRTGLAEIANISVPYYYDWGLKKWIYTGLSEPGLMISTELEIQEVQTIILAYVSGVNEGRIREGKCSPEQEAVLEQAMEYIEAAPFYIEHIPDFCIADIERLIKKYKRERAVNHFFFDYIHMSNKLIMEVAQMSKGMKLREDQILFLFVDTLKNLCNKLDVFILSSTQLNGTYKDSTEKDETMLRGAKSMADRIDLGEIDLEPSPAERKMLEPIIRQQIGLPEVNLIRHVYKLRGTKWSKIKVCQHVDLGTGRTKDLFVLNRKNEIIDIPVIDLRNIENIDKDKALEVEEKIKENSIDLSEMPEHFNPLDGDDDEDNEKTNSGYEPGFYW